MFLSLLCVTILVDETFDVVDDGAGVMPDPEDRFYF